MRIDMNRLVYQLVKDIIWKFTFVSVYVILITLLIVKFITYVNGYS
jgi:hypothetical protein